METPIDWYRAHLTGLPPLEDSWFGEALNASRAGDEDAKRRICGSCLRLVFDLAESKWRRWDRHLGTSLLDLVQDCNAVLLRATRTFTGSTAEEFQHYVEREVRTALHDLP